MWFLFTIRVQARIEQYVILANNYDNAMSELKVKPKLKPFVNEWGSRLWIVSCFTTQDEPKEI